MRRPSFDLPARRAWLRQPLVILRQHVLGAALALGLVLGGMAVVLYNAVDDLRTERERAALTRQDVRKIAGDVARLVSPSEAELVKRIQRALEVCRRNPACRARAARSLGAIQRSLESPRAQVSPITGGRPGARPPGTGPRPRATPPAPTSPSPRTSPPTSPPSPPPLPNLPAPGNPPGPALPPVVVDPPPIDPDGPGGLPPVDLPPIKVQVGAGVDLP